MRSTLASGILTALLYTQGLLGFAGLATIILKNWSADEPALVKVVASAEPQSVAR